MICPAPRPYARLLAALCCGALVAACAPDRVPGSTVSQGDAGIAFHRELASLRGSGASLRGASGASYGGGSSSSARGADSLASGVRDLRVGGKACDWATSASSRTAPARTVVERAKGAAADDWYAANCVVTGEIR